MDYVNASCFERVRIYIWFAISLLDENVANFDLENYVGYVKNPIVIIYPWTAIYVGIDG